MRLAIALLLLASHAAGAAECKVSAGAMPDVREREERSVERVQARPPAIEVVVPAPAPVQATAPAPVRPPANPGTRRAGVASSITQMQNLPPVTAEEKAARDAATASYRARRPALIVAIHEGNAAEVRRLAADGTNLAVAHDDGSGRKADLAETAVQHWEVAGRGKAAGQLARDAPRYTETLRVLLEHGAPGDNALGFLANGQASWAETPEAVAMARLLVRHGANPAARGNWGVPLQAAATRGNLLVLAAILESPALAAGDRDAALAAAVRKQSWKAAVMLIDAGADPDSNPPKPGACCSLLLQAMNITTVPRALIDAMVARGVDPNAGTTGNSPPLSRAVHDQGLMQAFLHLGADVNAIGWDGNTALHYAVHAPGTGNQDESAHLTGERPSTPEQRRQSTKLLLAHGARADVRNKAGYTPLMLASPDESDLVEALMQAGGTINPGAGYRARWFGENGMPIGPVTWALLNDRHSLAVAWVRKHGVGPEDCGAAYYAATGGLTGVLAALLDAQAPLSTDRGATPLVDTAAAGYVETVRLLLDRGRADVNAVVSRGFSWDSRDDGAHTALGAAAGEGHLEIVKLLLARGARLDVRDKLGLTALDHARHGSGSTAEVVALLEASGAPSLEDDMERRRTAAVKPSAFAAALALSLAKALDFGRFDLSIAPQAEGDPVMLPGDDSPYERLECERSASFALRGESELGGINVAECIEHSGRALELATGSRAGLERLLAELGGRAKPDELRKAGWYYAREELARGQAFHFFPTLVIGHGVIAVNNGLLHQPAARRVVIVQSQTQSLCSGKGFDELPLCRDPQGSMKKLALAAAGAME